MPELWASFTCPGHILRTLRRQIPAQQPEIASPALLILSACWPRSAIHGAHQTARFVGNAHQTARSIGRPLQATHLPGGPLQAAHAAARRANPPAAPESSATASGPGSRAEHAPKKSNTRLILLLAALVGIVVGGTIGILAFTSKNAKTPSGSTNSASASIVGVVSFTSSGGLKGAFTVSLPNSATAASSIQTGPNGKVLEVVVNNASIEFELGLSPYPGPGSYNLLPFQTNPAPGSYNGTVRISNHQSTWSLHPGAQCTVAVTSDTSLNRKVQNTPVNEVKGTFACPTLAPDTGSAAPINVTQGQFDVYALVLGS